MIRLTLFAVIGLIMATHVLADDHVSLNEKGNKEFAEGNYKEALDYYRQAEIDRPETPEIYYNHANALVYSGNYEEAAKQYEKALATDDVSLQAHTYYNSGINYILQGDYLKAIEAFKMALELNPDDLDAKYNLELVRNELKELMKRQPQGQGQKGDPDQKEAQVRQDQRDQQDQPDQNQHQQKRLPLDDGEERQDGMFKKRKEGSQPDPDEMSKEDALRILRALEEADEENQKNRPKVKIEGTYRGKDW